MKKSIILSLLFVTSLAGAQQFAGNWFASNSVGAVAYAGKEHSFSVQFQSEIVTNEVPSNIYFGMGRMSVLNAYLNSRDEPFPRTDEYRAQFEVKSNTCALFVLDGHTNKVCESSELIGEITRTTKTVITTQTNSVVCEKFSAIK